MKKFQWLLLLFPLVCQGATISAANYTAAGNAADNITIASGTYTDPNDPTHQEAVLFVKFTADYGIWGVWHTCAITWVKEFMAVGGDRTLAQAVIAKTLHGYKVDWNDSYKPAPSNINPWCIQ